MWIIYALMSAVFYAAATMFAKYSISKVARDQRGIVVVHAIAAMFLIAVPWILFGRQGLQNNHDVMLAILSGMLIGVAAIFYFKAYNMEDASVVTLLTQVIVPMTMVAEFIFLHHSLRPLQLFAVLTILSGITIATLSRKGFHLHSTKIIPIMFGATIFTTAVLVISKSVLDRNNTVSYTYFQTIGYAIFGILFTYFHKPTLKGFKSNMRPFHLKMLLVVGVSELLFMLALLAQFKSFTYVNAGLAASVGASEVFLSILLGYVLTKLVPHLIKEKIDKKTIGRKFVAGVLIVTGIVILNFVG